MPDGHVAAQNYGGDETRDGMAEGEENIELQVRPSFDKEDQFEGAMEEDSATQPEQTCKDHSAQRDGTANDYANGGKDRRRHGDADQMPRGGRSNTSDGEACGEEETQRPAGDDEEGRGLKRKLRQSIADSSGSAVAAAASSTSRETAEGRYGNCPGSSTDGAPHSLGSTLDDSAVSAERRRVAAARIAAVRQRVLARCAMGSTIGKCATEVEMRRDTDADPGSLVPRVVRAHTASEDNGLRSVPFRHDASQPADTMKAGNKEYGSDVKTCSSWDEPTSDNLAKRRRLRGKQPPPQAVGHSRLAETGGSRGGEAASGISDGTYFCAVGGHGDGFEDRDEMRYVQHAEGYAASGDVAKRRRLWSKGPASRHGGT